MYVCLLWERPTDGLIWNSCLVAPGPSPELPADFTPTPVLARHVTHPQSGTIIHTCSIYRNQTLRHSYTRFDTTICTSAPIFTITGKLLWPGDPIQFYIYFNVTYIWGWRFKGSRLDKTELDVHNLDLVKFDCVWMSHFTCNHYKKWQIITSSFLFHSAYTG